MVLFCRFSMSSIAKCCKLKNHQIATSINCQLLDLTKPTLVTNSHGQAGLLRYLLGVYVLAGGECTFEMDRG